MTVSTIDLAALAREFYEDYDSGLGDAVLAKLELVRSQSHASGHAEGLEEAARWHGTIAENHDALDGAEHEATAYRHRFYAACIRALASSDPAPRDQVAEEGSWLSEQIASARRDIARWPDWMKRDLAKEIGSPSPDLGLAAQEVERLLDLLERFRDFVSDNGGVREISTRQGQPTNHHNPIWVEIAEALSALRTVSASKEGDA